jgi:hypothetical protein
VNEHEHTDDEVELSDWPRMRLATDEDIERWYGSGAVILGPVVRPPRDEHEDVDEHDVDEHPQG